MANRAASAEDVFLYNGRNFQYIGGGWTVNRYATSHISPFSPCFQHFSGSTGRSREVTAKTQTGISGPHKVLWAIWYTNYLFHVFPNPYKSLLVTILHTGTAPFTSFTGHCLV